MSRKQLLVELRKLKMQTMINDQQRSKASQIDVGFLYASPLIFKDFDENKRRRGYQAMPQNNFISEIRAIKDIMKEQNQ